MVLLKTVNLRKQFGETRACDGIDFVVNKGEFLSLVGSNGAGKTTLVNLISAHLQPDGGQILLDGRDITFTTVTERIKAGIARSEATSTATARRGSRTARVPSSASCI